MGRNIKAMDDTLYSQIQKMMYVEDSLEVMEV